VGGPHPKKKIKKIRACCLLACAFYILLELWALGSGPVGIILL